MGVTAGGTGFLTKTGFFKQVNPESLNIHEPEFDTSPLKSLKAHEREQQ